ncbi:MAG TPA: hypothetical protein VFB69_03350 [Candidatus Dormibacteraeota bacterium]|nr:hypothetical protein [Candidatus Dormibacteraeota bacterium]
MRKTTVALLLGFLVLACGQAPRTTPEKGDVVLFVGVGSAVTALDVQTHRAIAQLPRGVASADWKHYYVASGQTLADYDPISGQVTRTLSLPGDYTLPVVTATGADGGLSANGQYLVLEGPNDGSSHLLIVDTAFTKQPQRIDDLRGDFRFDAISNDAERLYLIQHTTGEHYYVRDYVLGAGLDPTIVFDKSDGAAAMSGLRLMGVPSPGGDTLFSVYARKSEGAFIHQLFLDQPIAICIDLSGPGYGGDARAMHWSLALSRDGGRLFAVNSTLGVITRLDLQGGGSSTVPVDGGAMSASAGAALTPDGRHLIVAGNGVRWLDANSLHTTATSLGDWTVSGTAPAPDGRSIYVLGGDGRVAQLDLSGKVLATFDASPGYPGVLLGSGFFS